MSKIEYDPVKDKFSAIIKNSRLLRRVFYFLLDMFFLRSWHLRRVIRETGGELNNRGEWQLLDAGSGFGQYDRFILSQFENVKIDSVDVKEDYLADCRHYFKKEIEKGRISFYPADLLEFETEKRFDMAICIDVLEHIEEDVKVMKNIAESLKPGGYFLMHSPSHYSEEDGDEDDTFVGEHARPGYSKEEITEKLNKAGFSVENAHYTYGFWGHKAWILSVKWPMIWFNKLGLAAAIPLLIWYPVVLPFCLLMNFADLYTKNEKGNGIYALARKV
jgi:SAM-dependent methyltransferase